MNIEYWVEGGGQSVSWDLYNNWLSVDETLCFMVFANFPSVATLTTADIKLPA